MAMMMGTPFKACMPHAWPLPVHVPHVPGQGKALILNDSRKALVDAVP
jgi:hypothetical protein